MQVADLAMGITHAKVLSKAQIKMTREGKLKVYYCPSGCMLVCNKFLSRLRSKWCMTVKSSWVEVDIENTTHAA